MDSSTPGESVSLKNANNIHDLQLFTNPPSHPSRNAVPVTLVGHGQIVINPQQGSSLSDAKDLVALARHIQTADDFTKANATNKLSIIVEQIKFLQQQARKVLEEAAHDHNLHHVACNFKKIPGRIYYLYEKPGQDGRPGQRLFSMLSPKEWGASCPYRYFGAYKLQYDMSWTPETHLAEKEQDLNLINRFLSNSVYQPSSDPFAFSITEVPHNNAGGDSHYVTEHD